MELNNRPIGIDLFAGAGGMSLGFEQAGFDIAAAVELDPIHACVHQFNFPRCAALARSAKELSGHVIRDMARLKNLQIDVVFGGAPCQGFSLIGHRALDDPRNSLVKDFVRLATELEARYFVFENVKGLTAGKHLSLLDEVIEAFDKNGYKVLLPWRVLNAAEYGVPQSRQRLFLIGARQGEKLPTYPDPITEPANSQKDLSNLRKSPTCEEAIGDLPEIEDYEILLNGDSAKIEQWQNCSEYARALRVADETSWYLGYPRLWDPQLLTCSTRTRHTLISQKRFKETKPGETEPISRFFRLMPNSTCNTLRAGTDSSRGAFTSPRPIHYSKPRCITVREMARLHGFPDWFRFHTTKWHGARQIGNAVPPPLARHVAISITTALNLNLARPSISLRLGDPRLLELNMAQAADYFGIDVPISKRNRKSGAKKRKQIDIECARELTISTEVLDATST